MEKITITRKTYIGGTEEVEVYKEIAQESLSRAKYIKQWCNEIERQRKEK